MAHEEKLLEHLSKEIETEMNNLMKFRERINFAVFVGPFVLLSAILFGRGFPQVNWGSLSGKAWFGLGISLLLTLLSYLMLGICCSRIEEHMWNYCNKLRERIAEISSGLNCGFTYENLEYKGWIKLGYRYVYGAMLVAFLSAVLLMVILQIHAYPPPHP
ncbi:MAG TPA: hypothetical protein VLL54_19830 [Pyrinomonadaceae bacterium]|nr:hypothetical protein [Pyrinomonadaceae bacterium]